VRVAGPLLVLSLSLLAGCLGGEAPNDPGVDLPATPAPLAFLPEVPMPQLVGGAEPNLAALPDGTLFLTVPVGGSDRPNTQQGSAYLWRSQDGGQTWEVLRSPRIEQVPAENAPTVGAFCSCDADVVTSPDGWVYYSDWWISGGGLGPGNYLVESSADGGASWTANTLPIPQNAFASMDRQWLVAGDDGFVALAYSFFSPAPCFLVCATAAVPAFGLDRAGQAIEAVFSTDHGATWTDPTPIVPAGDYSLQIGHPRIAPDGNVWMPYGSVPTIQDGTFWRDPSQVRVAVVSPIGEPVADVLVAEVPQGFDNLWAVQGAQDPDTGRAYAVWAARTDDNHSALSISWSDDLSAWSPAHALDATGINVLPWADARAGNVTFGWYGSETLGDPVNETTAADAKWHAYAAEWRAGMDLGDVVPVQVSPDPVKEGPMCPRGAACGGDRELLDYVGVLYAPDGRLHYAFARSSGGTAYVHVATAALAQDLVA
jgi:hypothetical protein